MAAAMAAASVRGFMGISWSIEGASIGPEAAGFRSLPNGLVMRVMVDRTVLAEGKS